MFAAALNRGPAIQLLAQRGGNVMLMTKVSESKANNSDKQARAEERAKSVAQVAATPRSISLPEKET